MTNVMEVLRVEVTKLSLKPGDRLVFRVPAEITDEHLASLGKCLYEFLGPDIPGIIFVGNDMTISVIEPADKLFG